MFQLEFAPATQERLTKRYILLKESGTFLEHFKGHFRLDNLGALTTVYFLKAQI